VFNRPAAFYEERSSTGPTDPAPPLAVVAKTVIWRLEPPYSTFDEAAGLKCGFIKGFLHCNLEPPGQFSSRGERLALQEGGEEHGLKGRYRAK
jgi:hypothetical protein